jgi:hypothetical protein
LIWVPAGLANQDVNLFSLNYKFAKSSKLKPKPASIAHGDSDLATGKPVTH